MTKEYLLSKTLYGTDIIQHLIRKEFPRPHYADLRLGLRRMSRPGIGGRWHHPRLDRPYSRRRTNTSPLQGSFPLSRRTNA